MNQVDLAALSSYQRMFYHALRIRLVEERICELYPTDQVQSPVHLSIGQEHVAAALAESLGQDDLVFGTYRGHALYLSLGGDMGALFAELFGKTTGCGGGKAGSMHLADPDIGMLGSSAIVAGSIPHAVGAALAAKLAGSRQVCAAVFGDGATGEGVYHESLNMAATRGLPVLFLCENNQYAIFTRSDETHAYAITPHAKAYGIPAEQVENGMDMERVAEVLSHAVTAVRREQRPYVVEVMTYRYRQHVGTGEDFGLGSRRREDMLLWQERDPIVQNENLVARFSPEIEAEIDAAVACAEQAPFPSAEDLLKDVI